MRSGVGIIASGYKVPSGGGTGDTYWDAVLASSPVGFWPLNETSGSFVDKVAGRNGTRNGTLGTGTVFGRTCADFTGSTANYIQVADASVFSPQAGASGILSVEAIINPDGDGVWVCKGGAGGQYEWAHGRAATVMTLVVWTSGGSDVYQATTWNPDLATSGANYPVVTTFNRGTNTATIYVNGASVAVDPGPSWAGAGTNSSDTNAPITFGMRSDNGNVYDGRAGCVAIYNKVLSASEVAAHYAAL